MIGRQYVRQRYLDDSCTQFCFSVCHWRLTKWSASFAGVLVVLGLGTAVRLVLECCHERNVERSIQQMELSSTDAQAAPAQDADEPTVQVIIPILDLPQA